VLLQRVIAEVRVGARMCGIVAIVGAPDARVGEHVLAMNDALTHRGPDGAGSAAFPEDGVAIAMRRLAVLDIASGQQPMWDEDRRHSLVFNGEIYNHAALRRQLIDLGHRFESHHSDTEVLVHGFEEWGEALPARLDGMFAFAIWSLDRQALFVARDRTGEKPLHIAQVHGGYLVASEIRAFHEHPAFTAEVDLEALRQYLTFNYVLSPRSMLRGVSKLPPAHYAWITASGVTTSRYWTLPFSDEPIDEAKAIRRFDELLDASVAARMVADVPVGLLLSGGLDSTAIGYYARRHSDDVHSFSIGFDESADDESPYSTLAARHLGTTHRARTFSSSDLIAMLPQVAELLDEPLGDPSFFPTYALSQFARKHVTVALGGDGSDEFCHGYDSSSALLALNTFDRFPQPVRSVAGGVARLSSHGNSRIARVARRVADHAELPPELRVMQLIAPARHAVLELIRPELRGSLGERPFDSLEDLSGDFTGDRTAERRVIGTYVNTFLAEDILVKSDRASMAASLELRAPFLSNDLLEFYGTLPLSLKHHGRTGKVLLRRLMRGRIPDAILERPKRGFNIPLGQWLAGPLASTVDRILDPSRLALGSPLEPRAVQQVIAEQRGLTARRGDPDRILFLILQFELWRERWIVGGSGNQH